AGAPEQSAARRATRHGGTVDRIQRLWGVMRSSSASSSDRKRFATLTGRSLVAVYNRRNAVVRACRPDTRTCRTTRFGLALVQLPGVQWTTLGVCPWAVVSPTLGAEGRATMYASELMTDATGVIVSRPGTTRPSRISTPRRAR